MKEGIALVLAALGVGRLFACGQENCSCFGPVGLHVRSDVAIVVSVTGNGCEDVEVRCVDALDAGACREVTVDARRAASCVVRATSPAGESLQRTVRFEDYPGDCCSGVGVGPSEDDLWDVFRRPDAGA